jgi:CRP/FNR family transcriptional regulator
METFEEFLKQFRTIQFDKGEIVLRQHEVPTAAYVIKEGVIKTYNISAEGDEKPLSFDVKNEIFPVSWLFSKADTTLHYYEAFTACVVYVVPKDAYQDFMSKNPEVVYKILGNFIGNHVGYMLQVHALEQSKASEKLLYTLHYLCIRFGRLVDENKIKIQLPLTQQELANFMGVTRETTAIELKKLEKRGIISYQRASYSVNSDRLNELLDEEYGSELIL